VAMAAQAVATTTVMLLAVPTWTKNKAIGINRPYA
jgi:hypothetical protein